jgi:hypothetical protein
MEARELRIGNWVLEKQNKLLGEIFNITRTTCRIFVDNELEDLKPSLEDIEPIPLTEQWLERLGFKPDAVGCMYQDPENDYYGFVDRKEDGFMLVVHGEEHRETYVKYVHQLQNLFYELTGKELELKEQ